MARVLLLVVGLGGLASAVVLVVSGTATAGQVTAITHIDSAGTALAEAPSYVSLHAPPALTLPVVAPAPGEMGTSRVETRRNRSLLEELGAITPLPCRCCSPPGKRHVSRFDVKLEPRISPDATHARSKRVRHHKGSARLRDLESVGQCVGLDVARVLRSRLPAFRTCYERSLAVDAESRGSLVARLSIGATGNVIAPNITKSTVSEPRVAHCVLGELRKLTFATRETGVCIAQWTLDFEHLVAP